MTVWDALIGQDDAVSVLRASARASASTWSACWAISAASIGPTTRSRCRLGFALRGPRLCPLLTVASLSSGWYSVATS